MYSFFGNYLSNRIVHFAHLEMQLAASKNTFFLGAAWCDVSGYWELGCFSQKVFWSFSLKKSLNQYLSIPTVQCGHWAAIIFISDIGQQSATLSLVTHHLLAEDLVLGEERTSKKDRQRIMEGEYLLCLFIILFVVMNDAGLVNTVIVFSSESSRGGEKKSSIRRGRAESSVRFLYPHKNII